MDLNKNQGMGQIENKTMVKTKLQTIKFGGILQACKVRKRISGDFSPSVLIYRILVSIFMEKNLKALWEPENRIADCLKGAKKDSYYDLLKNPKLNWRRVMMMASLRFLHPFRKLSDLKEQVLILDDTDNPKTGKKMEMSSWQYDHVEHKNYKGYTQLHLGWCDGTTYLPIDFCIKVGKNLVSSWTKSVDKRCSGSKRRQESTETKLDQAKAMLKRALQSGINAGYVLFDTWFAKPSFLLSVFQIGYHVVCNIPKGDKIWQVEYRGKRFMLEGLYRLLKQRNAFVSMRLDDEKQSTASIIVSHNNGLEIKLVFCQPVSGDWLVFASTDIEQTDYEILSTYAKRWNIECFFKSLKQYMQFGKEQSFDLDVQISMTTIRMIAYSLTSAIQREIADSRTLGDLFRRIENEFSALKLDRDILAQIFALVLETIAVPAQALQELKRAFDLIQNNFASNGSFHGSRKAA